jgi:pentatricopeptide repeat protein
MHKQLVKIGLNIDEVVGVNLVDMYARCGNLEEARHAFNGLQPRNNILWSTMISGYAIHGRHIFRIELLNEMEHEGIRPGIRLLHSHLFLNVVGA